MAACLHDTLEDTDTTYSDLVHEFGAQVASLVLELTTDEDLKTLIGKTGYLSIKMKNMSSWALVIKLCDRLDNVSDLENIEDEEFAQKYIDETINILTFILKRANLTKTHISIIEGIISKLYPLCSMNQEKLSALLSMIERCSDLRNTVQMRRPHLVLDMF